jgi:hypothetical protein
MILIPRIDILPGIGLGDVRLGMQPSQVLAAFAEAQTYQEWMGGNLNDALLFHGICFHFDACNANGPLSTGQLNCIRIHQRKGVYLLDQAIEIWTKDSLQKVLSIRGFKSHLLTNGDIQVKPGLTLSFNDDGVLDWLEINAI